MIQLKRFKVRPTVEDRYGNCKISEAQKTIELLHALFPYLYDNGLSKFVFDSSVYAHDNVKTQLIRQQKGKCAFCEQHILAIDYGDVEHYRPKGAYVQKNEPLNYPGYYRLAYEFDNLLLCCSICNQRHKKNYFPIKNKYGRMLNSTSHLYKEKPFFINPYDENPRDFIRFDLNVAVGIDKCGRGKKTNDAIGLNRKSDGTFSNLLEKRLEKLNAVKAVYKLATLPRNNGVVSNNEIDENIGFMIEYRDKKSEFSAMINDNFPV